MSEHNQGSFGLWGPARAHYGDGDADEIENCVNSHAALVAVCLVVRANPERVDRAPWEQCVAALALAEGRKT